MSDLEAHRRQHPRLRLGIEAQFIALDARRSVILQDLSVTGAQLYLPEAVPLSQGVLQWLGFETFGERAWQDGHWCGLQFDEPLPRPILVATRLAAEQYRVSAERALRDSAARFVRGE